MSEPTNRDPNTAGRDWPPPSASEMSDQAIAAEMTVRERQWEEMMAPLEESGGASGSPGEWLTERLDELDTEIQRRKAT